MSTPLPNAAAESVAASARRSVGVRGWWKSVAMGAACLALVGCGTMNRRLTIRSDPPGALVLVDGNEVGYTPAQVDFTYYGTREITLVKDGYETLTTLQKVPTPWYQVFPADFVSDNFLPWDVTNRHDFTYKLSQQVIVPTEDLLQRANGLRSESQLGP